MIQTLNEREKNWFPIPESSMIDILKEMMKNDKPEQENETEAEKEE